MDLTRDSSTGVQTCALPIYSGDFLHDHDGHV